MLVVYASRAQLDRSQASASVQKGIKETPKKRSGDHASPITDVRAAVRKAKRTLTLWGNACMHAYMPTNAFLWCARVMFANGKGESSGPSNTPYRG